MNCIRAFAIVVLGCFASTDANAATYSATSGGSFGISIVSGSLDVAIGDDDDISFAISGTGISSVGLSTPTSMSWSTFASGDSGPLGVATSKIIFGIDVTVTNLSLSLAAYQVAINSTVGAAYSALGANQYAWAESEFALTGALGEQSTQVSLDKAIHGPTASDSVTDNLTFNMFLAPTFSHQFTITLTQHGAAFASAVPEPASLCLIGLGAILLAWRHRTQVAPRAGPKALS